MGNTHRRALGGLALAAASITALAGCSGGTSGDPTAAADRLVLGMTADINGWDPGSQPSYQAWGPEAVWDQLVQCDTEGGIQAEAAESWEISEDNRSFTAHLREGAEFSDGTPVDAAAVQATFEHLGEVAADRYADVTFDAPDDLTITITWPDPQPLMNLRVCSPYLTSAAVVEAGDYSSPVGSGPYTLAADQSTSGSVYVFEKNDAHWDADSYPYPVVELRVLDSETAALNALKTGQISGTIVTASSVEEAEGAGLEVAELPGGVTQMQLTDHAGETIPALGDVRVRQALNMIFDEEAVASQLFDGRAEPVHQIFGESSPAYLPDLGDPYPYDEEKAKELMEEAGYADGFTLTLPTMEGQAWTAILPYVTQQLGLLNITVEEKVLTGPDAITQLLSGEFVAPLWTLGGQANSVDDISVQVLSSGFWNVSHQPDATVDALWQQILEGDADAQAQAQQEINQYVTDQAWFVPIVSPYGYYAHSADVTVEQISDPYSLHPLLKDFR